MQWSVAAVAAFSAFLLLAAYYVFRRKRIRKEEELKLAQSYIDGLERERTRLAKDLHDGVCNDLLGIGMNMQYMQPTDESKREILALQISNNGKNYSGDEVRGKGIGLTTIQERAKAVGGLFTTDIQDRSQKFKLEISLSI